MLELNTDSFQGFYFKYNSIFYYVWNVLVCTSIRIKAIMMPSILISGIVLSLEKNGKHTYSLMSMFSNFIHFHPKLDPKMGHKYHREEIFFTNNLNSIYLSM